MKRELRTIETFLKKQKLDFKVFENASGSTYIVVDADDEDGNVNVIIRASDHIPSFNARQTYGDADFEFLHGKKWNNSNQHAAILQQAILALSKLKPCAI